MILLRHADAGSRDPARHPDDRARPLSAAGRETHPRVARALALMGMRFDRLLTSPLDRARQTAELTKEAFDWHGAIEIVPALGDGFSVDGLLTALAAYADGARVCCVGHEPHLSRFAAAALTGSVAFAIDLKPSGAIGLAFEGRPRPGAATLLYVFRPEHLAAIGC